MIATCSKASRYSINYDFDNEFENTEVEEAAAALHEVAVEGGEE